MTMNDAIVASSVYPIVAYFDTTTGQQQFDALQGHTFTHEQLVAYARQAQRNNTRYKLGNDRIIDISQFITNNPTARSVYVRAR